MRRRLDEKFDRFVDSMGLHPTTRERWLLEREAAVDRTVAAVHPDGSLTATGKHGSVHLPAPYVSEHVELAYAHTVMSSRSVARAS